MFKVLTTDGTCWEFDRWTDALNHGKSLMPTCKSWLEDIRILICEGDREEVVWVYSRSHKFPMYIGPRTYDRLANLFLVEAKAEAEAAPANIAPANIAPANTTETAAAEAQE
jgi:hypothetical protein